MFKEFTNTYEPTKILHRDQQIEQISIIFKKFQEGLYPGNIVIRGVTGSGKTTIIKKLIHQYNNHKYINVGTTKTGFKTLRAISNKNHNSADLIIKQIIKELKKEPKILILDELNKCKDTKNLFDDLNTIYRETQIPIICITNKRTFTEEMEEDAKKTLLFKSIEFKSYNAIQIKDILQERITELQKTQDIGKIPEAAINQISAYGARDGSARVAIELLGYCIGTKTFNTTNIEYIWKSRLQEDWKDFIRGMGETERTCLKIIMEKISLNGATTSAEIIEQMKEVSPGRVSQIITTFNNDYGIIKTQIKNIGRKGGIYRTIKISTPEITRMLEEAIPLT